MEPALKRIGLLVGSEGTFPSALIQKVHDRHTGVSADYVKLAGVCSRQTVEYDVILDRISHQIPFYRSFLKFAALAGVKVINNPFWWSADDKFFNYSLGVRLGVAIPRTILLPQKSYNPSVGSEALGNLEYPLDWDSVISYIGLPAVLKPVNGGGWRNVSLIESASDLMQRYDASGTECMVLQEYIRFDQYVRTFCIGDEILPIPYDPVFRRYLTIDRYLDNEVEATVQSDARKLNNALGYEINTVEFAIKGGVPYAIDYMNPAPEADWWIIGPRYFNWVVEKTADLLVASALSHSDQSIVQLPRDLFS